jgi:hypothetical protein
VQTNFSVRLKVNSSLGVQVDKLPQMGSRLLIHVATRGRSSSLRIET